MANLTKKLTFHLSLQVLHICQKLFQSSRQIILCCHCGGIDWTFYTFSTNWLNPQVVLWEYRVQLGFAVSFSIKWNLHKFTALLLKVFYWLFGPYLNHSPLRWINKQF